MVFLGTNFHSSIPGCVRWPDAHHVVQAGSMSTARGDRALCYGTMLTLAFPEPAATLSAPVCIAGSSISLHCFESNVQGCTPVLSRCSDIPVGRRFLGAEGISHDPRLSLE